MLHKYMMVRRFLLVSTARCTNFRPHDTSLRERASDTESRHAGRTEVKYFASLTKHGRNRYFFSCLARGFGALCSGQGQAAVYTKDPGALEVLPRCDSDRGG